MEENGKIIRFSLNEKVMKYSEENGGYVLLEDNHKYDYRDGYNGARTGYKTMATFMISKAGAVLKRSRDGYQSGRICDLDIQTCEDFKEALSSIKASIQSGEIERKKITLEFSLDNGTKYRYEMSAHAGKLKSERKQ